MKLCLQNGALSLWQYPVLIWVHLWLVPPLSAQINIEWDRTYGGNGWEELQTVILTNDGGYLFTGLTTTLFVDGEILQDSRGSGDFWLVKTNSEGQPKKTMRYGGSEMDRAWAVQQTADGGFIVGGESPSGISGDKTTPNRGGLDWWLLRLDPDLNIIWQKSYGGTGNDVLRTIISLPDGYLLCGYSDSNAGFEKTENSRGSDDFWIVRTDLNGNVLWDKTIGGTEQDRLFHALEVPGGFVLGGYAVSGIGFEKTEPAFGLNDYWVLKIDDTGNILWQITLGGDGEDALQSIWPTLDGGLLIMGLSASTPNTGNKTSPFYGVWDAWLVKLGNLDTVPDIQWQKTFGGAEGDLAYSAVQNSAGYFLVAGLSYSPPVSITGIGNKEAPHLGGNDFWILYLTPAGDFLWEETLGGTDIESCTNIVRAHDYGYILGGHSSSNANPPYKSENARGLNDIWVVRTFCDLENLPVQNIPKVCKDESVSVNAAVTNCPGCLYFWDDGVTGPDRTLSPDTSTQLKITVIHPDGCEKSDSLTIEIIPGPEAFLADLEPISCYGETDASIVMDSVGGGFPPFHFSLNGSSPDDFAQYFNLPPGNYHLAVTDVNGCSYDSTFQIIQPEEVLVELGDDIFLELGDSVQLQALTNLVDSFTFIWGQPDLLSCSDCLEPWVRPFSTATFSIRLKDKNGCEAKDHLVVVVEKNEAVYAPNVFSPNNDNINDFFTIYADRSVRNIRSLLIFDRWGEKMFEQKDFLPNIEQLGWDGWLNGRRMNSGVFVWWAEVEFIDGRVELLKGGVTLVR